MKRFVHLALSGFFLRLILCLYNTEFNFCTNFFNILLLQVSLKFKSCSNPPVIKHPSLMRMSSTTWDQAYYLQLWICIISQTTWVLAIHLCNGHRHLFEVQTSMKFWVYHLWSLPLSSHSFPAVTPQLLETHTLNFHLLLKKQRRGNFPKLVVLNF